MTTFHEQMKNAREFEGRTIRDYQSWTLQDYRDFMFCVEKGYLVQGGEGRCTLFIINEEWEEVDIYAEEFLEEHEYEIEYGNMLDENTRAGEIECFSPSFESAIDRFKELVAGDKYDQVDLVERYNVIDGCCESSDVIMEHRKEHPSYLQ